MTVSKADLDAARQDILDKTNARFDALAKLVTPDPPPPPTPAPVVRWATHRYFGNGPKPADASFFDLQQYQGFQRSEYPAGAQLFAYLTTCSRKSDAVGWTTPLTTGEIMDSMLAHYPSGSLVTRKNGDDTLLNLVNPDVLARFETSAVADAGPFDGIYLDEVDLKMWGYSGVYPREFPSEAAWAGAHRALVLRLSAALHNRGKKLWVNLGADYDLSNPVQLEIVKAVDGVNIEFFVGREGVSQAVATGADWLRQTRFVRECEVLGTPVHVHASTIFQPVVDYAFGSWLIATEFRGSFTASREYSGAFIKPSPYLVYTAGTLGAPIGAVRSNGINYERPFQGGVLEINSQTVSRGGLAPMTWRIV